MLHLECLKYAISYREIEIVMMWRFHQQLQLSVEWYNITAVSVVFCQLVKLDKLSLSDCIDNVEENDVKRGNSQSL